MDSTLHQAVDIIVKNSCRIRSSFLVSEAPSLSVECVRPLFLWLLTQSSNLKGCFFITLGKITIGRQSNWVDEDVDTACFRERLIDDNYLKS